MGKEESGVAPAERTDPGPRPPAAATREARSRDFWDPRVQSKYWLDTLGQTIDLWLRSVAFLELMQHGLETAIAAKHLQDLRPLHSRIEPHAEAGPHPRTSERNQPHPPIKGKKES